MLSCISVTSHANAHTDSLTKLDRRKRQFNYPFVFQLLISHSAKLIYLALIYMTKTVSYLNFHMIITKM